MYPRHRLDGLGDAIYGVSMTLLVLDVRIPDTAQVVDSAGFAALIRTLWPHLLPYLIKRVPARTFRSLRRFWTARPVADA